MCVRPCFVSMFSWMLQESAELKVPCAWDTLSALPLSSVAVRCCRSSKSDPFFSYAVSLQNQHRRLRWPSKFKPLRQFSSAGKRPGGVEENHSRSSTPPSSLPVRGAPKQPYNNKWKRGARSLLTGGHVLCKGFHRPSCV